MARKDFNKGMEAGARPFEEMFQKQSEGFEKVANDINRKIDDFKFTTDTIIDDLNSIEKKRLYDLNTVIDIAELGEDEKEFLMAALYTLANMTDYVIDHQQTFLRSVKNYIKVENVQTIVDLAAIENIENINDQKAILQTIMEFLFLENGNHGYIDEYGDVLEYFSVNKKGIREIQECIDRIYKATGLQGIAENYGYVVLEETEENDTNNNAANEAYDGSDICEKCADVINVNDKHVILKEYLVYHDNDNNKLYRVSKKDGEKIEINLELDFNLDRYDMEMLGCDEKLVLVFTNKHCLVKVNINTFESLKLNLIGNEIKKCQCNEKYIIYLCNYEGVTRLVKVDFNKNDINILEHIVNNQNVLACEEYYLIGEDIYLNGPGSHVYGEKISEKNQLNYEKLYKFHLNEERLEAICEHPSVLDRLLFSEKTCHYNNILFSVNEGNSYDQLKFTHLDMENPKAIKNTMIAGYCGNTYSFIGYEYIFYVVLDCSMSIRRYNIITGEDVVILKSTQCADSYTTGIFKKETHYYIVWNKPQVIGKWLYYVGRTSKNVRKASIDVVMGESEEILVDDKPVHLWIQ